MLAMLALLGLLIAIYLRIGIGRERPAAAERWLVHVPFSVYLGWAAMRRRGCGFTSCGRQWFVRGETVLVKRVAPLGDPVEYIVKGYNLSLRRCDAGKILVQPIQEERGA